jgi:hypothetical protein
MPGRSSGFNIKGVVIVIVVIVAVSTCVWLTMKMKSTSWQTARSLKGPIVSSVQPEGLKDPLPQVTTEYKEETPIAFAVKKKGVFTPDWPIKPREDKKDIKGSVEITEVNAKTTGVETSYLTQLREPAGQPFAPEALPTAATTEPMTGEGLSEDTDEEPASEISPVENAGSEDIREDAGSEDILPKEEGGLEEAVSAHILTEDMPPEPEAGQAEASIEWQANGDAAKGLESKEQEEKPVVDPPKLFVSGIIVSDDVSYAIVKTTTSSVIVQPGDEIEGATVKSVKGEAVVVVKQDEEFVLELGGGGE